MLQPPKTSGAILGGKVDRTLKKNIGRLTIGQPGLAWPLVVVMPNVISTSGPIFLVVWRLCVTHQALN